VYPYSHSSSELSESEDSLLCLALLWIRAYFLAAFAIFSLYSCLARTSSACLLIAILIAAFLDSAFSILRFSSASHLAVATLLASSAASSASLMAVYLLFFSSSSAAILARTSSSVFLLISSSFFENSRCIYFST